MLRQKIMRYCEEDEDGLPSTARAPSPASCSWSKSRSRSPTKLKQRPRATQDSKKGMCVRSHGSSASTMTISAPNATL